MIIISNQKGNKSIEEKNNRIQLSYAQRHRSLNILSSENMLEFPFSKTLTEDILQITGINHRGVEEGQGGILKKSGNEH